MQTIMETKEQAVERREAWEREKDLIFPDRVAMRVRLNAPKKDTEKDLLARVSVLEGQIAAGIPVRVSPAPAVRPATRAETEIEGFRRIRERL